jgi:hypothetical protein
VDITVYLPDEVAQRAKAQNVNLSRILRDALTAQFAEEDAVSATLEQASTVTLELQTEDGRAYRGRMAATLIGEDATTGTAVYLRRTGEVIAYRAEDRAFRTLADPAGELLEVLPTTAYIAAMDALGIVPEVDLDAGFSVVAPVRAAAPARAQTTGQKLRAVPGDIVEPPVRLIKRLTGHGDAAKAPAAAAELSPSPAPPEGEALPEVEALPEPDTTSS